MKAFVIDLTVCNGCYGCQIACKDEHCGNDWTPYAKPQPDTGQFWMRIDENVRGKVPRVKVSYVPILCQHCKSAPCIPACPYAAIVRRPDGLVYIDPKKCVGCERCLDTTACPYKVIFWNETLRLAQKCTGCAHLVDRKVNFAPRCGDACPTDAILFGEDTDLASSITGTEILNPEFNTNPSVHYKALPKRFIAGLVYDKSKNEIIEGATCTLSGAATATTKTDGFGDFWFEGLPVGTFSLTVAAAGKPAFTQANISTQKDVSLDDIGL
jgi:Fe-S-cluster-containing dehydrogenase component